MAGWGTLLLGVSLVDIPLAERETDYNGGLIEDAVIVYTSVKVTYSLCNFGAPGG